MSNRSMRTITIGGITYDVGGLSEEEIQAKIDTYLQGGAIEDSVEDWLDNHPEATTTVQDGAVSMQKLATDVQEAIANAGTYTLTPSNVVQLGTFMEKPDDTKPYVAWPFYDVQYDASIDKLVYLVNVGSYHDDNPNYNLYVYTLDLHTYEVEEVYSFDHSTEGHGMYSCGFCIDSNGKYIFVCTGSGDSYPSYIYTSTDKGETWTNTTIAITAPFGLMQLSNGRYICHDNSQKGWIYYSSDLTNWTKTTIANGGYENCIIELDDGNLICLARKSWSSTDNDSWNGTMIVEPAIIAYSSDYGATWTSGTASATITEMSADNCCGFYHEEEGLVELFVTSRYPHLNSYGICYQYIAKLEDAKQDNWGEGKVLFYPKAKTRQDFGYIAGCKDANGDMHIMYYDGDANTAGSTNYYYMKASRQQVILPLNADASPNGSVMLPYSANKTDAIIKALRSQLMGKINQIIIDTGGDVDDEGDGSFYVTDGLYDFIDFTNLNKWDGTAKTYTGSKDKLVMKPDTDVGSKAVGGGSDGAINTTICPSITSGDLPFANGVTIEFEFLANGNYDDSGYRVIGTCRNHNSYSSDVGLIGNKKMTIPYTNTSSASKTAYVPNSTSGTIYASGYHHVVLIRTGTYAKAYYDGLLIAEQVFAEISDYSTMNHSELDKFTIAGIWSNENALVVKSCRVYAKALSDAEVRNNYIYESNLYNS